MDPKTLAGLDPKLRETYERVMGAQSAASSPTAATTAASPTIAADAPLPQPTIVAPTVTEMAPQMTSVPDMPPVTIPTAPPPIPEPKPESTPAAPITAPAIPDPVPASTPPAAAAPDSTFLTSPQPAAANTQNAEAIATGQAAPIPPPSAAMATTPAAAEPFMTMTAETPQTESMNNAGLQSSLIGNLAPEQPNPLQLSKPLQPLPSPASVNQKAPSAIATGSTSTVMRTVYFITGIIFFIVYTIFCLYLFHYPLPF